MNRLLAKYRPVWNADNGGSGGGSGDAGGGGDGPAAGEAGSSLHTLLGGEGGEKTDPPPAGEGGEGGDKTGAADWKEYVADPNKSDEENAAAKLEHDKTKPTADDPADKVPDDGKYTLTMPEGVEVDQELLDALGPDFKELGLTNRQAQALADKFIKIGQDRETTRLENWSNRVTGWVDQAKADKDMGGAAWPATTQAATRAINVLGTPELKAYLESSGGGNHPELIRFAAKAGALIREDDPAAGGAEGEGKPVDPAHRLFPNDAPKG